MSWIDNLRPASFRGVPFHVDSSKKTLGRRVVNHEFPNRETNYTQDLGRISNAWTLEGYVIGSDYDVEKKKLEDAFNKYGPGELVHPYDGLQMVQIGPVEFTESKREGAILYFSATIYEAGSNDFPKSINDKAAILGDAASNALDKAKGDFDSKFSIAGMPGFAVASARAKIASAQKAYDAATKGVSDISEAAAKLAFSTRSLVAETNDLLSSPSSLSQRLLDSFNLLQDAISSSRLKTDALTSFFNFGSDDPGSGTGVTPVRKQEAQNKEAFNNLMRRAAVVNAAVQSQQTSFTSFKEAEEKRDQIVAIIDEQILTASDDIEVYQALADVRAALIVAVPDEDADLPGLKEIVTDDVVSSLHVAYDIFQDIRTEDDIIQRNSIKNPAFIPADTKIEVLDGNV